MQLENCNVVDHRIAFLDKDGVHHSGEFKAYCWKHHDLPWSAARLFYVFFDERQSRIDVGKEIKKVRDRMDVFLEFMNVACDDVWIAPRRSCNVTGEAPSEQTVSEWTMTTDGLLYCLIVWSQNPKSNVFAHKALMILAALLATTVSAPEPFDPDLIIASVADAFALCTEKSKDETKCQHVLDAITMLTSSRGQVRMGLVMFMVECASAFAHCPACRECLRLAVHYVSDQLRAAASAWQSVVAPILKPRALDHRGKALRHDDAFKQRLKERVQRRRKCITAAEVVALQGSDSKCVRNWRIDDLAVYQRAAWRSMSQGDGVFVIRADAAQLANPWRDTTHYFESARTGITVILLL